jgi:hypothetical protein
VVPRCSLGVIGEPLNDSEYRHEPPASGSIVKISTLNRQERDSIADM